MEGGLTDTDEEDESKEDGAGPKDEEMECNEPVVVTETKENGTEEKKSEKADQEKSEEVSSVQPKKLKRKKKKTKNAT